VEQVWKRVYQAQKDAGVIIDWLLFQVQHDPPGTRGYQYVYVVLADSREALFVPTQTDHLSFAEREISQRFAETRTIVSDGVWELELTAVPFQGFAASSSTVRVGYMDSTDAAEHIALEREIYRKVWREHAKLGHISNHSVWRRIPGEQGGGLFDRIGVFSFPPGATPRSASSAELSQAAQRAFPHLSPEQVQSELGRAEQVRKIVGSETWTMVDSTFTP
jgi:hypothetical protein